MTNFLLKCHSLAVDNKQVKNPTVVLSYTSVLAGFVMLSLYFLFFLRGCELGNTFPVKEKGVSWKELISAGGWDVENSSCST